MADHTRPNHGARMHLAHDRPGTRGESEIGTLRSVVRAAALAFAAIVCVPAGGALAATPQVNVDPQSLVTYGGVIRHAETGEWRIVAEGSHVAAGFRTISCDARTGALRMTYDPLATVASAWVVPDETLARRGILAGPSVATDHWVILFTRITAAGPQPLNCDSPVLRGNRANLWVGVVGQRRTSPVQQAVAVEPAQPVRASSEVDESSWRAMFSGRRVAL